MSDALKWIECFVEPGADFRMRPAPIGANGWTNARKDTPIAAIFSIKRSAIEEFEPVVRTPIDDPALWAEFTAWRQSRNSFNEDLQKEGSEAQARKWQKAYMTGPEKDVRPPHRTKLRLRNFSNAD